MDGSKFHTYSFERLEVWRMAKEFVLSVYQVTSNYPASERFGLSSQLRRAALSVYSKYFWRELPLFQEGTGKILWGFLRFHDGSNCPTYDFCWFGIPGIREVYRIKEECRKSDLYDQPITVRDFEIVLNCSVVLNHLNDLNHLNPF